jgi:predicted nucleotidyltransferase
MSVLAKDTLLHLYDRQRASRLAADARAQRLLDRLPKAQEILVTRFQAQRVWLFGSLATNKITETSDVDLAVEQLPESSYFSALAALMELFGSPVDLVRMETVDDSLRNRIEQEGRVL